MYQVKIVATIGGEVVTETKWLDSPFDCPSEGKELVASGFEDVVIKKLDTGKVVWSKEGHDRGVAEIERRIKKSNEEFARWHNL